jgi:hypothetical protein
MSYEAVEYTYQQILMDICRYVGHPVPADPAGSQDPAVIQMGAALNFALEHILTRRDWHALTKRATLAVVADSAGQEEKSFALPADFSHFVEQTQWSQGSSEPAGGPISTQAWQSYIVRNFSMQLTLYWQLRENLLWFLYPPHPTSVDFEYMYISKGQVIDADDAAKYKNRAAKNGDTFVLDGFLLSLLARYHYLSWKGFDTVAAESDFNQILESRTGTERASPVLSLVRRRSMPLIDPVHSVPDTGYGL